MASEENVKPIRMPPSAPPGVPGIPGLPDASKGAERQAAEIRERLFILSLEFSRRAMEARSFEELCYLLTNDIRALIEFDRSFLIIHMSGESRFVGASNQPVLDKKSKFDDQLNSLAVALKELEKPLLLKSPSDISALPEEALTPDLREALAAYMQFAKCTGVLCVPLNYGDEILGHLLLESLDGGVPDQIKIIALIKLVPFFSSALAQKWVFARHPELAPLTQTPSWRKKPVVEFLLRYRFGLLIAIPILVALLFLVPFSYPVGGEADIAPKDRHVAFAKMDGLIERIHVMEGSPVEKGQVIATLDPTEIDFRIKGAQKQLELLTAEATLLKKSSGQDVSKLAESRLVDLKAMSAQAELQYLQWQRQFLQIKAPASGIVTTKHVETLVGKKFKAGEPFCEFAVPGELLAEIYVPEDKISRVKPGQAGDLHLNDQPRRAQLIQVKEVAPRAEALPRLGNVYRVKAAFQGNEPPAVKVGMKGVGTIYTDKSSLYSIITQRLYSRWNQFVLRFQ